MHLNKQISVYFCLLLGLAWQQLRAQHDETAAVVEKIVEEIIAEQEIEADALYDDLTSLALSPLDLNAASRRDLAGLYMLTDFQMQSLLQYRADYGQFSNINELLFVPGYDLDLLHMLQPFVYVNTEKEAEKLNLKNALQYGRNQVFFRTQRVLEMQDGYAPISDSLLSLKPNSRYLGNPFRFYTRYGFNYHNRILFGFTAEKDPGEEFFTGSNPRGFDYYSFHLQLNDIGFVKTFVAGDYQARFGQGLTLWSGFSFSKSPMALNIKKTPMGLSKYSSTDENRFFRGAAVTAQVAKNTDFTLLFSSKKVDANITQFDTLNEAVQEISALQATGLHATPNAIADENAVKEQYVGGNVTYNALKFRAGLTFLYQKLNAELQPDDDIKKIFSSPANENMNAGVDYHFMLGGISFFGEAAVSGNRSMAFVSGAHYQFNPQIALAMLYRNYDKGYYAPLGAGFGEQSATSNEQGFYTGIELVPVENMKISAYMDVYKFPWLRYRTNAPSNGYDYLLQADYHFSRQFSAYFRMKRESKAEEGDWETSGIAPLAERIKSNYRLHYTYRISEMIATSGRAEFSFYEKEEDQQKGFLLYQDLKLQPAEKLNFTLRYALFDTDDYQSRIYTYEHNVLYTFSIPALFDEGSRFYILTKYSPTNFLDLWARYAITSYANKKEISSGLNHIEGSKRSDISLQMRLKF